MRKCYTVELYIGDKYIATVDVIAFDEDQARELAWGLVEQDFCAKIKEVK